MNSLDAWISQVLWKNVAGSFSVIRVRKAAAARICPSWESSGEHKRLL
jgi:hypothetical protein